MIASPEQVERRFLALQLIDKKAAAEIEEAWPRALGIWDAPADTILEGLPKGAEGWTAGLLRGQLFDDLNDRIASAMAAAELAETVKADGA